MVPIPYRGGGDGRTDARGARTAFRCPTCGGRLGLTDGSWSCGACGHVPAHGAD